MVPESMNDNICLVMKTYLREFQLLLDGEQFYDFQDFYGVKGGSRFSVKIPGGCAGKKFTLRTSVSEWSSGRAPVIYAYLGAEGEVFARLLWENFYALLFGIGSFLMVTILLILSYFLKKQNLINTREILNELSCFIFLAGVWIVTDSGLLLCVTNQVSLVNTISFVSFFIMLVYLLRFVGSVLNKKQVLNRLCWGFWFFAAVYLFCFIFSVFPGYLLLIPEHLLCFLSMGIMLNMGRKQIILQKNEEVYRLFGGFCVLIVFAVVAFVVFYINPTYDYSIVYCIGIFLFYLVLLNITFRILGVQIREMTSLRVYKRMAYTDSMSGMENRAAFMEEQKENPSAKGRGYIVMDINNLKVVNDRHGHYEGDCLIQDMAGCIREVFGEMGKCYRIGGDEFVVILDRTTERMIEAELARLEERVKEENKLREIPLSIAAGFAVWKQAADTAENLYRRADADMYMKKQKMKEGMMQ